MKLRILKLSVLGVLVTVLAGLPLSLPAQTNTTPAAPAVKKEAPKSEKKAITKKAGEKKGQSLPFRGKLTTVDKMAKTITVGQRTFQITSTTKMFKADKPAVLEDGVVGELVTGSYKTNEDGKLSANSVYFGGRTAGKIGDKADGKKADKTDRTEKKAKDAQ